jgi:hypothetical protein
VLSAFDSVIGGSIATALLFAGLALGALAIGLAVTLALALVYAIRSDVPGALGMMLAYSFVFILLTWPMVFLTAGALWGKWE